MTQTKENQQKIGLAWLMGIFLLIGILFVGVLVVMFTGRLTTVYITVEEVHQRIRSEIPPGSTYSQVNDFLKTNGWGGTSKLSKYEDFGTHDDMLTEEEKQKIKWNHSGGIQTAEKNLFWSWGIVMEFYYDQEGKLITYNLVKYRY